MFELCPFRNWNQQLLLINGSAGILNQEAFDVLDCQVAL
jgi:hypothetical protein